MTEKMTVELPVELAQRARAIAAQTHRPVEAVLVEWIDRAAAESPVELLPDEAVLALCDAELEETVQEEMSELLERRREGALQPPEDSRLDDLMQTYRRGLVRKAQGLKEAVARGLKPRLS